jgi:hypothetical protein
MPDNRLYYGDNLDVLRRYVPDGSVDLVYLDPLFNSNATDIVTTGGRRGCISALHVDVTRRIHRGAKRRTG